MKELELKRHIVSAGITIAVITILTILSELNDTFKNFLTTAFYQHWIGKGVLALLVFFICAQVLKFNVKSETASIVNKVVLVTILAAITIFMFFVWDAFK